MPKLKTHQGSKKRIKFTGTGKLRRRRAFRSHLLTKKRSSRKRNYVKEFSFSSGDKANAKKMRGGQ